MMKQLKALKFKDVLEEMKRKEEEFNALSKEEQERLIQKREEILSKLRGKPGFAEFHLTKGGK